MAAVSGFVPAGVCANSRAGNDVGVARLPWPTNVAGDVLEFDDGDPVRVDVVPSPTGCGVGGVVKVALLPART